MSWIAIKRWLQAGVLALIVTVGSSQTVVASPLACEKLFPKPSIFKESFLPLKNLVATTDGLVETLKKNPEVLDAKTVEARIIEIESLTEAYLFSAGIPFKKSSNELIVPDINKKGRLKIPYGVYYLSGSRWGDETARLLEGTINSPKLKKYKVEVVFDPLYEWSHPRSVGSYRPEAEVLLIGPRVVDDDTKGIRTTLRHEIQHYLEQVKVFEGKMSLARTSFWESLVKEDFPYKSFLRMDEMEAHLRDLRSLFNSKTLKANDTLLKAATDSEQEISDAHQSRSEMIADKKDRLQRMIQHSNELLEKMRAVAKAGEWTIELSEKTGSGEVLLSGLIGPYSQARIELSGLMKVSPETVADEVTETVLKVIDWNKQRTLKIEAEFNLMKAR